MTKFFKTKADIKNPEYDGRCKYGSQSVKFLKEGSIVERKTTTFDGVNSDVFIHFYYDSNGNHYSSEMFKKADLEEIDEVDSVKQFEFEYGYCTTKNLVKHLLKKQIITMDQVRDFYNNPIEE
jgi:hypothetical protein